MTATAGFPHPSPVVAEPASLALVDEDRDTSAVQCAAETAECTCPEFCERDHGNE
jgi:hypothetical protein